MFSPMYRVIAGDKWTTKQCKWLCIHHTIAMLGYYNLSISLHIREHPTDYSNPAGCYVYYEAVDRFKCICTLYAEVVALDRQGIL